MLSVCSFLHFPQALIAAKALSAGFSWGIWLPYFTGVIVLIFGLSTLTKETSHKHTWEKFIALGPMFLAVPIAVFGADHFTAAKFVARLVPAWIPGHLFWVLLVGICLICAALSIAVKKYAGLAAALLGIMLILFVFLIHIPAIVGAPGSRILWAVALRDLAFSGGALSLAAIQAGAWEMDVKRRLITIARLLISIPTVFFGVEHFLHPEFTPGVPLAQLTPLWIPAHLFWSYLTGMVFIVAGLSLIINWKARLAATCLGLEIFLLVLVIYVPIVLANPSDIGNGLNYLADTLMLSGSALSFAGSQSGNSVTQAA